MREACIQIRDETFSVVLDEGSLKSTGVVLKITPTGMLIEMEKIMFKVGAFLNASIMMSTEITITEQVRSIRHYDKFYRTPPRQHMPPGEKATKPMKLCEVHFQKLSPESSSIISKYLIHLHDYKRTRAKKVAAKKNKPS